MYSIKVCSTKLQKMGQMARKAIFKTKNCVAKVIFVVPTA